jgi:putative oxidoreductase
LIPYVNKGELAVVYCFVFFYIFLRGSGSWGIDGLVCKGKAAAAPPATT